MSELNSYDWENHVSGLAYRSARYMDSTSVALIASTSLETAGAVNTAAAIFNMGQFKEATLYVNCVNGPAANAGTTGLTVFFQTRPASAISWFTFRTETGAQTTGLSAYKIIGSGVASLSGVTHFEDVKITVENTTDSSGTATVQAWAQLRTP